MGKHVPSPNGASALCQKQLKNLAGLFGGMRRRVHFRGGLALHSHVLQDPVDLSLLAYSDYIRVS